MDHPYIIRSLETLTALYGKPSERAILKQNDYLDENSCAFIAASPFAVLATYDASMNVDCSPRGDEAGFVQVLDEKTLALPDRRGNNRLDSLRNIIDNPSVGLLFFVPGMNETFRVNGTAHISVAPDLLERFTVQGKPPKTILVVSVTEAFIQCSRALLRSNLWNPENHHNAGNVPSIGTILAAHTKGEVDARAYDLYVKEAVPETLY